jgi:hypothetical protein
VATCNHLPQTQYYLQLKYVAGHWRQPAIKRQSPIFSSGQVTDSKLSLSESLWENSNFIMTDPASIDQQPIQS